MCAAFFLSLFYEVFLMYLSIWITSVWAVRLCTPCKCHSFMSTWWVYLICRTLFLIHESHFLTCSLWPYCPFKAHLVKVTVRNSETKISIRRHSSFLSRPHVMRCCKITGRDREFRECKWKMSNGFVLNNVLKVIEVQWLFAVKWMLK